MVRSKSKFDAFVSTKVHFSLTTRGCSRYYSIIDTYNGLTREDPI